MKKILSYVAIMCFTLVFCIFFFPKEEPKEALVPGTTEGNWDVTASILVPEFANKPTFSFTWNKKEHLKVGDTIRCGVVLDSADKAFNSATTSWERLGLQKPPGILLREYKGVIKKFSDASSGSYSGG